MLPTEYLPQNVASDDHAAVDTPQSPPRGHSLKTVAFEDAACSTAEPDPPPHKTNASDAKKRPENVSPKRTRRRCAPEPISSTANVRKSPRDCEMFEKPVMSLEIPTTRLSN